MTYNFDEITERKNTDSLKFDFARERGKPDGLLPLWVADMDFKAPDAVIDTLVKRARHGIFGYTEPKGDYFGAVQSWFKNGFGFETKPEWLVKTPGVVFAIACAVRAFTQEGDGVLIQGPVYYSFLDVILANGRKIISNSLVYKNNKYHIDFDDFEQKITRHGIKVFVLCNPHNPTGNVWTKEDLVRMGEICSARGCLVVSDEIHCDFVFEGFRHVCFGVLGEAFLNNSVICTAPNKTFNLAGLQIANNFIANAGIRRTFKNEIKKTGYSQLNTMGLAACRSAYENGRDYLLQLNAYLAGNLAFLREFLKERLPRITLVEPQGTYLIWLNFSALGFSERELSDFLENRARLWLDAGTMFGPEGAGFARINIACPRAVLNEALLRLEKAL